MTEGPGQQPPQDPRSTTPEGGREVLEGRVIPSRSQAQRTHRQYDAPPRQTPPQDDPRQQFAAPPHPGPEAGATPQAPGAGPAWGAQQPPHEAMPQQQGYGAPQHGYQTPPAAQGRQPEPASADPLQAGEAAAVQQRMQQIREAAAAEEAAAAARTTAAAPPPGGGGPGTPDWTALAERQAASGARRRKIMMLTGGIVAVAVIAGGVATAVVVSGKGSDDKAAAPTTSAAASSDQASLPPSPTFSSVAPPPPPNPLDYLTTAAKDTAPLTAASLFPDAQFVRNGHTYVRTNSDSTTTCRNSARGDVAKALTANGCHQLVRATYTSGAMAVTVGVAVFDDAQHSAKLKPTPSYLAPLNGGGIKDFCHAVLCQMTANQVGRYAYFAISGYANGKTLAKTDTVGKQTANEVSDYAFQRIIQRGKDAAAADPNR